MSPLTRKPTNIQLSLIHVNPLSDVPILDTLMSFAYVRRHASFPLASHLAVSSNAVRVGYTVVRFNRVRIELTFYHYSLKRTHNLGLGGGPNFRWQYKIQRLRWYLIEDLSSWASKVKLENHLWKVLDHIAEKEKLPDVRHVLEKKSLERKLGLFDGGHFIFKKSYSPPRLPDLCLWLWESENLRKKIHRSTAYDPRLDYEFWKCDCHYRHLEIGYRIFNENTPRMSRVSVIRCSRCETMHGGAGPHKSRIKPHFLNTAKQYELSRGKGFKVVGSK